MSVNSEGGGVSLVYCGCLRRGTTSERRARTLSKLVSKLETISSVSAVPIEHLYARTSGWLDVTLLNKRLTALCLGAKPDVVWFDKATKVRRRTLQHLKSAGAMLVHVNPDDPFGLRPRGWSLFLKALSAYDVHFVPRMVNVDEYRRCGASCVYVYDRSFDPDLHRPLSGEPGRTSHGEVSVGFVGSWAKRRSDALAYLIAHGVSLRIWGDGWKGHDNWDVLRKAYEGEGAYGEAYVRRLNDLDIVLHFLREENRDEQDSRTYEIPGCGRFMLAERSRKHLEVFREGEEADFFDSDEELLCKVRHYKAHPAEVRAIAMRGYQRAIMNYTHEHRLSTMLGLVEEERRRRGK